MNVVYEKATFRVTISADPQNVDLSALQAELVATLCLGLADCTVTVRILDSAGVGSAGGRRALENSATLEVSVEAQQAAGGDSATSSASSFADDPPAEVGGFSVSSTTPPVTTTSTMAGIVAPPPPSRPHTELERQISSADDDLEVRLGESYPGSTDLELGNDNGRKNDVWLRFNDLDVWPGATIESARVYFTADDEFEDAETNLTIHAELAPNAGPFSDHVTNIASRALSVASLVWYIPASEPWRKGEVHATPDLSPLVQEIVSLSGWAAGHSLVLKISGSGERDAASFEDNAALAPRLRVSHTDPREVVPPPPRPLPPLPPSTPPPSTPANTFTLERQISTSLDDLEVKDGNPFYTDSSDLEFGNDGSRKNDVWLRFTDLQLPALATIISARIEFTVDENDSGETDLTIVAEAADDAQPFSSASMGSRESTTASVGWTITDSWNKDEVYKTPDLSALVQEVVNRDGWGPASSLAFKLSGSGERTVESYDGGQPHEVPKLLITYATERRPAKPPSPPSSPVPKPMPPPPLYPPYLPPRPNSPPPPPTPSDVTYMPGELMPATGVTHNIKLSVGLKARLIAKSGEPVQLADGTTSATNFHTRPDGAAVFEASDGGWAYASNSESGWPGGVGAIRFNADGEVIDYYRIVDEGLTSVNCGVGKTPMNTLLTMEEKSGGQVWEASPFLDFPARKTQIGAASGGGKYESGAYDNRSAYLHYFVTEDTTYGALRRYTPGSGGHLAEGGTTEWLIFTQVGQEDANGVRHATYEWRAGAEAEALARDTQAEYFPGAEGIDFRPFSCTGAGSTERCFGRLYFVGKKSKSLVILDTDSGHPNRGVAQVSSTESGAFNRQPDQISALVGHGDLVYFCEDGGDDTGVHARDGTGKFYSILDGYPAYPSETTGLAFSPDQKRMYMAFQDTGGGIGYVFEITREDGYKFGGATLDIKYHAD